MNNRKVSLPEGRSGAYFIKRFEVSEEQARRFNLGMAMSMGGGRYIYAGTYTGLYRDGMHDPIMSDTPAEIGDHVWMFRMAKGRVLINGLGIGMVLQACLQKPEVEHATVVEISPDVIALVGNHYKEMFGDRLTIVEADALLWKPPKGLTYNVVWHDIWNEICADNWDTMSQLHRKYGRRSELQSSWCRRTIMRLRREEQEQERRARFWRNL